MNRHVILFLGAGLCLVTLAVPVSAAAEPQEPDARAQWAVQFRKTIERYLGYPYHFGGSGPKRFDCSGFVWRVMADNGVRIKRTSARKLYLVLPRAGDEERWELGSVVFFSGLRHCGLVDSREHFFHASSSRGTIRSSFAPYWGPKIEGCRKVPRRQA